MVEYLASIFGTEKDKVNCSFHFKIGACRHLDHCSRTHAKPSFSELTTLVTKLMNQNQVRNVQVNNAAFLLFKHLKLLNCYRYYYYINSLNSLKSTDRSHVVAKITNEEVQEYYDNVYEDIYIECEDKYGEIEEMNICENLGKHLAGNVYIKFRREVYAKLAVNDLNNRWFGGLPIYAELSPVTNFRSASCHQYEMGRCPRQGFCNFLHIKPISKELCKFLNSRRSHSKSQDRVEIRRTISPSLKNSHRRTGGSSGRHRDRSRH